jgi:hypothetical protein
MQVQIKKLGYFKLLSSCCTRLRTHTEIEKKMDKEQNAVEGSWRHSKVFFESTKMNFKTAFTFDDIQRVQGGELVCVGGELSPPKFRHCPKRNFAAKFKR